jgi:hypothetical protein
MGSSQHQRTCLTGASVTRGTDDTSGHQRTDEDFSGYLRFIAVQLFRQVGRLLAGEDVVRHYKQNVV